MFLHNLFHFFFCLTFRVSSKRNCHIINQMLQMKSVIIQNLDLEFLDGNLCDIKVEIHCFSVLRIYFRNPTKLDRGLHTHTQSLAETNYISVALSPSRAIECSA